jgi:hypothetical protein
MREFSDLINPSLNLDKRCDGSKEQQGAPRESEGVCGFCGFCDFCDRKTIPPYWKFCFAAKKRRRSAAAGEVFVLGSRQQEKAWHRG